MKKVLLWLCSVLVFSKGCGSLPVFTLSVAVLLGVLLAQAFESGERSGCACALLSLVAVTFCWPLVHLFGFWACSIGMGEGKEGRLRKALTFTFLAAWLLMATSIGSWIALPWVGIPAFVLLSVLFLFVPRWIGPWLGAGCIAVSVIGYLQVKSANIEIAHNALLKSGYAQGPVLARVLDAKLVPTGSLAGDLAVLRFNEERTASARRTIRLIEHGDHDRGPNPILGSSELVQGEPWTSNQLFGDQYLLAAIAQDGQWASNLGGQLKPKGKLLLASGCHHGGGRDEPLVIEMGKTVYVQDSDPFVDRLVAYQPTVLRELTGRAWGFRVLNCLFVGMACLPLGLYSTFGMGLVVFGMFVGLCLPRAGDVRIVGSLHWPHEPSKTSGVLRSLADAGYPFIRGDKRCRVLFVDEGRTARVGEGESLVVACPGSTVFINGKKLEIGDVPQGDENGVIDSRKISGGSSLLKIGGTTVIGTGSPAKQQWSLWLH